MKDKLGFEIPEQIAELWNEADKVGRDLCGQIHRIKLIVEKGVKEHDLIFRELNQGTVIDLDHIWQTLKLIIPYAVCPLCEGEESRATCLACRGCGFVSKFRYDRSISRDVKAARLDRLAKAS